MRAREEEGKGRGCELLESYEDLLSKITNTKTYIFVPIATLIY